jgi:small subunit ribosomal protein S6e
MSFKINIGTKEGKTYKLEVEAEGLMEKSLGDKISGKDIYPELDGYEFEITGTSDSSGFTSRADVEGIGLKKVLLTYGKGMHKRSKREGKKKRSNSTPGGLKLRKTIRGKIISSAITQINLKLIKEGSKKLSEIFSEQNKSENPEKGNENE